MPERAHEVVQREHGGVLGWERCQEGAQETMRSGDDAQLRIHLGDVAKVWHQSVQAQAVGYKPPTRNDGGEASCRGQGDDCPSLRPRRGCSRCSRLVMSELWMSTLGAAQHSHAAEMPHCAV